MPARSASDRARQRRPGPSTLLANDDVDGSRIRSTTSSVPDVAPHPSRIEWCVCACSGVDDERAAAVVNENLAPFHDQSTVRAPVEHDLISIRIRRLANDDGGVAQRDGRGERNQGLDNRTPISRLQRNLGTTARQAREDE
jgi:hypothetical protein